MWLFIFLLHIFIGRIHETVLLGRQTEPSVNSWQSILKQHVLQIEADIQRIILFRCIKPFYNQEV